MGREQNVLSLRQPQPLMNITRFDLIQIRVQHLRHGASGHKDALLRQSTLHQIPACVFRIAEIDIADNIHYTAIRLLWQAFVLAAVARLHMEIGMCSRLAPITERQELVSPRTSTASGFSRTISL